MSKLILIISLLVATTSLTNAASLDCKQKFQLFTLGQWQTSESGSNYWHDSTVLPGYLNPFKESYAGIYDCYQILGKYTHKSFYNQYSHNLKYSYYLNMKVTDAISHDWGKAFSNANYRVDNRVFGWWLAYPWSLAEGNFSPATRSYLNLFSCYLGTDFLLTGLPEHFILKPANDSVLILGLRSMIDPTIKVAWQSLMAPLVTPFQNNPTSNFVKTYSASEMETKKKVDQVISFKEIDELINWGQYLMEETEQFQLARAEQYSIHTNKLEIFNAQIDLKRAAIRKDQVCLINSFSENEKYMNLINSLAKKGFNRQKVKKALKPIKTLMASQNITHDDSLIPFTEEILEYPPSYFGFYGTNNANYVEDPGYFLSMCQKSELIFTGRVKDSNTNIFNINYIPGYLDPAFRQFDSIENDFLTLYQLIDYKNYLEIYDGIIDNYKGNMLSKSFKCWPQNFSQEASNSYSKAVAKSSLTTLFFLPIGLVGPTFITSFELVDELADLGLTVAFKLGFNSTFNSVAIPATYYTWNTAVSPLMALTGQKPAISRCDGTWVKPITKQDVYNLQNLNAHITQKDIADLTKWAKILQTTCRPFSVTNDILSVGENLQKEQYFNVYKTNIIRIAEVQKEFLDNLKIEPKMHKTLEYLQAKGFNSEKVSKAERLLKYELNYKKPRKNDFEIYKSDSLLGISMPFNYDNTFFDLSYFLTKSKFMLYKTLVKYPPMSFKKQNLSADDLK